MALSLTSLGGAATVTGSKHLLEHDGRRLLDASVGIFAILMVEIWTYAARYLALGWLTAFIVSLLAQLHLLRHDRLTRADTERGSERP